MSLLLRELIRWLRLIAILAVVVLFAALSLLTRRHSLEWMGLLPISLAWPALMLATLIISSLAESTILVEYDWLAFVVCSVKAARELSWRPAFALVEPSRPERF